MVNLKEALKRKYELHKQVQIEVNAVLEKYGPQLLILDRMIAEARKVGIGKKIRQFTKR